MKIFVTHRPGGAYGFITDGWLNALRDKGHNAIRWDGSVDTWDSFSPDLYIGASGHKQPIPSNRSAKIAIHVNPVGPVNMGNINESQENINWTVKQKPDVVFGYGFESDRVVWSGWTEKYDIPWVPMPTAGDKTVFLDTQRERINDIVYLGGRWPYKGLTIDTYLLPLLRNIKIKSSLYGWGDWPDYTCNGILPDDKVVDFLNSGKVGPCISEKHTQQFGIDIPERVWKLALCGTLAIHDPIPTLKNQFKNALIAKNAEQYRDLCIEYSRTENQEERNKIAEEQKQEVLKNHTYHNRIADLFFGLGWEDEAKHMIN